MIINNRIFFYLKNVMVRVWCDYGIMVLGNKGGVLIDLIFGWFIGYREE